MSRPVINRGVTLYTADTLVLPHSAAHACKPLPAGTPNGWKVSIALKEMKYPHKVHAISMSDNDQKQDWFLKINPNGRIPAIVDHDNDDYPVFESGSILMYLGEKSGQFYPQDFNKRHEVNQWLFFQNAGVGPMQGQANHFNRYAPEKIEYGMKRYTNEAKRLYEVMDSRLQNHEYLAADEYTIADMSTFGWVFASAWAGLNIDEYPNLKKWMDTLGERSAVQEGLDVPEPNKMKDMMADPQKMKEAIESAQKMMVSTK